MKKYYFLILLLIPFFVHGINTAEYCPILVNNIDSECNKLGEEECQKVLEECEAFYDTQSDAYQSEINKIKQKEKTLQNEIWSLSSKIKNLDYNIYKNNLVIKDLSFQIEDTSESIQETNRNIEGFRKKLGLILRLRYEEDRNSYLEVFLAKERISDFFDEMMALESLNRNTQKLIENIKGLKLSLEDQKDKMEGEKTELEDTQTAVGLQKQQSKNVQIQKQQILNATRGEESLYQKFLDETEEKASEIRKKKFQLVQVVGEKIPTLEEAYLLAKEVEKLTGVRAAFLLGLLKVESNIGNNVGQCNCAGQPYCRHPDIHWKEIMTQRHWTYFIDITKELGMDPNATPLSCAISGGKVQWGGAMGPGQFMPQTWVKYGYKAKVEEILGVKPANPWRIRDAVTASGLYMKAFGAAAQTQVAEIGAARGYLCGTTKLTNVCRTAGGQTYAYNILHYAAEFQDYIDRGILR